MPTIAIGSWALRSSSRTRRRALRRSTAAFSRYSRSFASSVIANLLVDQGKHLVVRHRGEVVRRRLVLLGLGRGHLGQGGAQSHADPLPHPAVVVKPGELRLQPRQRLLDFNLRALGPTLRRHLGDEITGERRGRGIVESEGRRKMHAGGGRKAVAQLNRAQRVEAELEEGPLGIHLL